MRTVTLPPPDDASTMVARIFSCNSWVARCAWANSSCGFIKDSQLSLVTLAVVDHAANLGAKLFLHAADHRIISGARTGAAVRSGATAIPRRCGALGCAARQDLEL